MISPSDSSNLFSHSSEEGDENDDRSIVSSPQGNPHHHFGIKNRAAKMRKQSESSLFSSASFFNNDSIQHINLIQDISASFFSYLKNQNALNLNESMMHYETTVPRIKIAIKPSECLPSVFDIISSDNVFINKVLSAFAILFCEIDSLIPPNGYQSLLPLVLYGESEGEEAEAEIQIANMLPFISSLSETIKKLIALSMNLINQLVALFNPKSKTYKDSFHMIILNKPFDYLGKVFSFFNAIDLIINVNPSLSTHWKAYRYMIGKIKDNLAQFNLSIEDAKSLEKKIRKYSSSIMSGKLLDQCIKHIYENAGNLSREETKTGKNNETVLGLLSHYITSKHSHLYSQIGSITETEESLQMYQLLSYIPYLHLIQIKDYSSIYQSLWSIQTKVCNIHIVTGLEFNIELFLSKYRPKLAAGYYYLSPKNPRAVALELFSSLMNNYETELTRIKYQVHTWLTRMGSDLFDKQTNKGNSIVDQSKLQIKLILNGLILLHQIRSQAISLITSHSSLNKKTNSKALFSLIESLELGKVIETQFNNSLPQIAQQISLMYSVMQNAIIGQLTLIEDSVIKKYQASPSFQSDILSSIDIFTVNLDMVPSSLRRTVNSLCFDIIQSVNISQAIRDDLEHSMWELDLLSNLTSVLQSNNDWISFSIRDLLPDCFTEILNHPHRDHLTYFLASLTNSSSILSFALHKDCQELIRKYQKTIASQFEQFCLIPIALAIDRDIRLQIALENIKELTNEKSALPDCTQLLTIKPLTLFDVKIDIKGFVEEHLNKSFYELNALNPNDWKTYQQMKAFGKMKYGLSFHDAFLPIGAIDSGVGLLDIVKVLPNFLQTYNYDLLNQLFIEEVSKGTQAINVVSPQQIVNTFNTHSIGTINSIINKIFQWLAFKLKGIVAILVDDKISSIIYKEKLFWNEGSAKHLNVYPYVKAHKFLKDNGELISGLISMITQIGNALALVRTIKTALMTYLDNSIKYSSNSMDDLVSLLSKSDLDNGEISIGNSNSKERDSFKCSYSNAKGIVTNVMQSLITLQGSNYLNLLVSSFDNAFTFPEIEFYHILLPACFLAHVESNIIASDNCCKKNASEGHYCNDGFVLGVAYLNKILKQEQAFDSLSWFQSVNRKYEDLKAKYSKDETKQMALRRIDLFQRDFELVASIYQAALMLFNG